MFKVFDYLYYKLYQVAVKSTVNDIPQTAASFWMGALLAMNCIAIEGFLSKVFHLPFIFKKQVAGAVGVLFGVPVYIIYNPTKRERIIRLYSNKTNRERIIGNIVLAGYIATSLLLVFAVAFFRPIRQ